MIDVIVWAPAASPAPHISCDIGSKPQDTEAYPQSMLGCILLAATIAAGTPAHADRVIIQKEARQLTLLRNGKPFRSYRVSLGSNPIGAKEREGDGRTPEGLYTIDSRNAGSKYHMALHVSYPNAADRLRARRLRVSPGGEIMIHGTPNRWR
ncbi:MAG: L,D-transpeptidase family protein, partial [Thermoanaerobaculia bacterium]